MSDARPSKELVARLERAILNTVLPSESEIYLLLADCKRAFEQPEDELRRLLRHTLQDNEELEMQNHALRNLANNLRPGPISEALAGKMVEEYRAAGVAVEPNAEQEARTANVRADQLAADWIRLRQALHDIAHGHPRFREIDPRDYAADVLKAGATEPLDALQDVEDIFATWRRFGLDDAWLVRQLRTTEPPNEDHEDAERYRFIKRMWFGLEFTDPPTGVLHRLNSRCDDLTQSLDRYRATETKEDSR